MTVTIEQLAPTAVPHGDAERFLLDRETAQRLEFLVVAQVEKAFTDPQLSFAPDGSRARATDAAGEFFSLYSERPVRDNSGGSGFNDSLWLFVVARAFEPALIVESGVHRGHSTWLLRQACPDAELFCYDIDLSRLIYRDPKARYHEGDWMEAPFPALDPGKSLGFFDDHISHALRLRQAHDRGFRQLLFDDNFPAHNLYATGGPPVPTLAMMMDPDLRPGREIVWSRNGKAYHYHYQAEDLYGAAELITRYLVLPDLAPLTRYSPGSALTLVKTEDEKLK